MNTTAPLPDLNVWLALGQADRSAVEGSDLLQSLAIPEQGGWDVFHQLLRSAEVPARLCTDAYLAAVAIANGWRLVSFDRDFERFQGLARLALPGVQ